MNVLVCPFLSIVSEMSPRTTRRPFFSIGFVEELKLDGSTSTIIYLACRGTLTGVEIGDGIVIFPYFGTSICSFSAIKFAITPSDNEIVMTAWLLVRPDRLHLPSRLL